MSIFVLFGSGGAGPDGTASLPILLTSGAGTGGPTQLSLIEGEAGGAIATGLFVNQGIILEVVNSGLFQQFLRPHGDGLALVIAQPPPQADRFPAIQTVAAVFGAEENEPYTSQPFYVLGIDASYVVDDEHVPLGIPMAVTNADYSLNDAPFTNISPVDVYLNDKIQLRVQSSTDPSTEIDGMANVNGMEVHFRVTTAAAPPTDVTPAQFTFDDLPTINAPNVTPGGTYTSNTITISDINAPIAGEAIGPVDSSYSHNGAPWMPAIQISGTGPLLTLVNGDTVALRLVASLTHSASVSMTFTAGPTSDVWTVATDSAPAPDTTPLPFFFVDELVGVPLNSPRTSNAITVLGIDSPSPMTISAGGLHSVNGAPFTANPVNVNLNDQVVISQTSSGSFSTETTVTLTIGGVSDPWTVRTLDEDLIPDSFSFPAHPDAALNTAYDSDPITITGINGQITITVTGGTYSKNAGAHTSAPGLAVAGDQFIVRGTSSPVNSTPRSVTLTAGGASAAFVITTVPDTTPAQFTFTDQPSVTVNQLITSDPITILAIEADTACSVSGAASSEWNKNGGAFQSTAGTVSLNDLVRVRHQSSASNSTQTSTTFTAGGISDAFVSTTEAAAPPPDVTPDAFSFAPELAATPGQTYTSAPMTVLGIDLGQSSPMTVTSGEYSKNNGPWLTAPTTVVLNDTVRIRRAASPSFATAVGVTLTINGISGTFSITTIAAPPDTNPDQFTFTDQLNVARSALITSNTQTITGINAASNLTLSGGGGVQYSKNGTQWVTAPTTVVAGDTIQLRMTSSGSYSAQTSATLTVGTTTDVWVLTTLADPGNPSVTPLASPNWLVEAEDYPYEPQPGTDYTKPGVEYNVADYTTRISTGTVLTAANTTELLAALAAARSNSAVSHINLTGGVLYSPSTNAMSNINRTVSNMLVVQTTPGHPQQALFSQIYINDGNVKGLALVDLDVSNGLRILGAYGPGQLAGPRDILIERCVGWMDLQGCNQGSATAGTPFRNLHLRLNVLRNHWALSAQNRAHGVYSWNTDGLFMEGNIVDHNGWQPGVTRAEPYDPGGGATIFEHNCYLNRFSRNTVVRFNWLSRASSHGTHTKGGAHAYRNHYACNPIGTQMGYGGDGLHAKYGLIPNSVCNDNLFVGSDYIFLPTLDRGQGIRFTDLINGYAARNYFLFDRTPPGNSTPFFADRDFPCSITLEANVSYSWPGSVTLGVSGSNTHQITQLNNRFTGVSMTQAAQDLCFANGAHADWQTNQNLIEAYVQSRLRRGVDIRALKQLHADIISGIS